MASEEPHRKQLRRYNLPGHAHELTFSCYRQQPFLLSEAACRYLADAIVRAKDKHQFDLWAYVLMPEHVHMLICPRFETYSVSDILLSIKQPVARKILNYLRKQNPKGLQRLATGQKHTRYRFWQDGAGYDRNITSREALINAIDYIHANPVRRGLVDVPENWPWSSARDCAGLGSGEIPIDKDSLGSL